ncbi:MAG TPA: peptide chain release factor 1 [Candidatus Dormibacteraeota bacterium]|nr:peptide chain release factor 1 [Candidatus Dormibacteraeota bacterium]
MIDRLESTARRYRQLQEEMARPQVVSDPQRLAALGRELRGLEDLVRTYDAYREARDNVEEARGLLRQENDPEMQEFLHGEERSAERRLADLEEHLRILMLPKDPNDDRDVVVQIQAAEGGQEAALFAADLFRMYSRWVESRGWKVEVIEAQPTGIGGFDKIEFEVHGEGAYSQLKFEAGVHRVQRVPETESQGRIHTSAATVAVLPEADEVEVQLPEKDLKIDTSTSTGPGGQSVNTTYSAIRITHLPTGMVVSIQDEKSQLKNKEKALRVLRTRLYEQKLAEQHAAMDAHRRSMVRSGSRSEKIRTYNFKENRVTDHRINVTLYKLDRILSGELDELLTLLAAAEREAQINEPDGSR